MEQIFLFYHILFQLCIRKKSVCGMTVADEADAWSMVLKLQREYEVKQKKIRK